MKKLATLLVLLFISSSTFAQNEKIWVFLKDKGPEVEAQMAHPENYLSLKSLFRRQQQGISIHESDVPVYPQYISEINDLGFKVIAKSKWLNAVSVEVSNESFKSILMNLDCVIKVEAVNKLKVARNSSQSLKTEKTTTYGYGVANNNISFIKGVHLHDMGYKGQGMTIAVLDGGFSGAQSYLAFDSLNTSGRLLGTYNFVARDTNVYKGGNHGMSVLSTMAGLLDTQIVVTAPKANYYLLVTEDDASESTIEEDNWVEGAEYADSVGADVINSSLGYSTFDDSNDNYSYSDMDGRTTIVSQGAIFAARKGILVCVSAGNEGGSSWRYITSPGDTDSILTVGAIDNNKKITSFSSRGPSSDGRIKPDVVALGGGAGLVNSFGFPAFGNGTSFSSPIIAGMTACLWQANKTKTNQEIIDIVRQSASKANNPDTILGYGIPNYSDALPQVISVEENHPKNKVFSVYPNPFKESLTINSSFLVSRTKVVIQLSNFNGKVVFQSTETYIEEEIELNLPTLPSGIYFILLSSDQETLVEKLIHE